jgi:hypothetical protein
MRMTRETLVSVVIDNFNYADYLGEAIASALAQTWPHVEVIVVDDGSTDGSRDILASWGERIRPVLQANRGQAAAFNAGVAIARGDIICFLDSDDVWHPEKVARVVAAFERYPDAAWLRHKLRVVDVDKRPQGASLPRFRGTRVRTPVALAFIEGCYPVLTSAVALRRSLAERVFPLPEVTAGNGGFPGVDLMRDADAYLAFRAASTDEPFLSLDEELGLYRRHPHQRYVSVADIEPILHRQIALAAGVASAFADRLGTDVVPSSVFKHRAVLAAINGRSLVHRERLAPVIDGVRRILPLARVSPRLFARQSMALALGTLMPRTWVRKLLRQQGFVASGDAR